MKADELTYIKQLYLILIFACWGCYGQLPIRDLYKTDKDQSGVYYKDTFNDYDKFVGTWKYTNGTTSLTIVLQKKLQQTVYESNTFYYDIDYIVGGYKYVENGIEMINTIPQLSLDLPEAISYYINGYTVAGPNSVYCLNCNTNDRVLLLGFLDPNRDIFLMEPEMLFKRVDSGGIQKLELDFRAISAPPVDVDAPAPEFSTYTVPFGKYILTKVN